MRLKHSARLLSVGGLIFSIVLSLVAADAQSTPQDASPKLAEQQYKNIKVLNGIPADQVIPAMQFISASLGVDCEYCHVHGALDKDDKKSKLTARKMITMMMAINKDNFEGHRQVTCYSCHHGVADPVATPIITDDLPKLEMAEAGKPALPAADALLDKYLAAVGGVTALQKITSRVQSGTVTPAGQPSAPIEVYSKAPDKRVSFTHLKESDSVASFDGQQGWLSLGPRVHVMSAPENDAARVDADLYFPVHVKTLYSKFTVAPGEKIDGHDTYLVVGRAEGKPPLRLYFDQQSGLLLRMVRYAETPLGRNPTQIDYADYRDADGVKLPFRWTQAHPGNRFTIQVEHLQQNIPVEDAKFGPPPTPPPPPSH